MNAHGGALDDQRQDPEISTGLDFSNDTEVPVLARGTDDRTGIEYGATVELEADTDTVTNADETWIFLRGDWGELRFGDVDGPVEASSLGADTIAAGTGGIDGDIVDELALSAVRPTTSEQATKIRYYTPSFAGFQLGVAYTPNADALATSDAEFRHWVEGAVVYGTEVAGADLQASIVGSVGETHGDELPDIGCGPGTSAPWPSWRRWRSAPASAARTSAAKRNAT